MCPLSVSFQEQRAETRWWVWERVTEPDLGTMLCFDVHWYEVVTALYPYITYWIKALLLTTSSETGLFSLFWGSLYWHLLLTNSDGWDVQGSLGTLCWLSRLLSLFCQMWELCQRTTELPSSMSAILHTSIVSKLFLFQNTGQCSHTVPGTW